MAESPRFDPDRPVDESIDAFLDVWDDAQFGPAHIVLSDSNLEDVHIRWCLDLCRAALTRSRASLSDADVQMMDQLQWYDDHDRDELAATAVFLEQLLTIPEAARMADVDDLAL